MASKRSATTELNHENWNDEEKVEEAGVFKQAEADVLKSRVIKKARRRGDQSTESNTGGTFASFSGFKSSSGSGTNKKPNFDFLNGPNGSSSSSVEKPPQPLSEVFKPKPGSWKCGVCDISNESTLSKCAACSGPKPGADANSSNKDGTKWTCGTCLVPNGLERNDCACCQAPKPSSGNSKNASSPFSSKEPAKWTCGTCLVPNGPERNDCACCQAPNPSSGGTKKAANNNSGNFKFGTGGSVTSSGFSFGSSGGSGSGFMFGSSPVTCSSSCGFKLASSTTTTATGFKFGGTSTTTTGSAATGFKPPSSTTKPATGFKFGATTGKTPEGSTPTGFKFTSSVSATKSSADSKSDSESVSSEAKSGQSSKSDEISSKTTNRSSYVANLRALNKQLAKWVKTKVDENPNVILTPIFEDYEQHLKDISEKYLVKSASTPISSTTSAPLKSETSDTATLTTSKETTTPSLASKTSSTASTLSSTSSTTLPVASKSSPGASPLSSKTSTQPLFGSLFGSKNTFSTPSSTSGFGGFGSGSPTTQGFTFGKSESISASPKTETDSKNGKEDSTKLPSTTASSNMFSFGSSSSKATFSFGDKSSSTGFKFDTTSTFGGAGSSSFFSGAVAGASSEKNNDEKNEDAEEDQPPKVEVNAVEEEDAKHSVRCKLYYKKEKDFVEKGLGTLHLKIVEDGKKIQMIVRAETNLGNIILNIIVNDKMTFTQRGNNVQFVAVPNPPIPGLAEGPVTLLVKVKNATLAEKLNSKLKELIQECS